MIEKIARDVSEKLNATPSRDFDGMIGLAAHLRVLHHFLDLNKDDVKIVAIAGPAGIGKTTIARALQSVLSTRFQLNCFVDNLRGSYPIGLDEYGLKLRLQEQFLSNILNQNGLRINHLGVIEERLCDQRVLIILDDVNDIKQLEALANKTTWFGPGSVIVVTTENKELLQQHGINKTYHVGFPSTEEALKILYGYAFRQSYSHDGFEKLAERIVDLCGKLPLGLRVVGSSLRGKKGDEWEDVINRLETTVHGDIEDVLRVGYESLDEYEQTLFLHIAVFFNYKDGDLVKTMFAGSDFDVKRGLEILVNRSLIDYCSAGNYLLRGTQVSVPLENQGLGNNSDAQIIYKSSIKLPTYREKIVMHKLLRQMARQVIRKQEPWKRQILVNAHDICDVLENETGTGVVTGISFDISGIDEVYVSDRAFRKMSNLRFLRVYKSRIDGNARRMHIPEEMELPRRLRLLHWVEYPSKCLPLGFRTEYLIEINMKNSKLEYLWQGTKPLKNVKKMELSHSYRLKELPDLSSATNMEKLNLACCESLVEIPSSFSSLHKLQDLTLMGCINLQVIPAIMNLASLEEVNMKGCLRLRNIPVMSTNIKQLDISRTAIEDVPESIRLCSRLKRLTVSYNANLKEITQHLPTSVGQVDLSYSNIEKLPDYIVALPCLGSLNLSGCRRLKSLPKFSLPLGSLSADDCGSLETVFCSGYTPSVQYSFTNCFKLGQQARKEIIRQSFIKGWVCLPGKQVPEEFDHQARGSSLTIPPSAFTRFKVCLVISHTHQIREYRGESRLLCRRKVDGNLDHVDEEVSLSDVSRLQKEHLFIFHSGMQCFNRFQVSRKIVFEFSSVSQDFNIIKCGAKVLKEESIQERLERLYIHDFYG